MRDMQEVFVHERHKGDLRPSGTGRGARLSVSDLICGTTDTLCQSVRQAGYCCSNTMNADVCNNLKSFVAFLLLPSAIAKVDVKNSDPFTHVYIICNLSHEGGLFGLLSYMYS